MSGVLRRTTGRGSVEGEAHPSNQEVLELREQNKQLRQELDELRIERSSGLLVHELNQSMAEELNTMRDAAVRLEQARAQDLVVLREKVS